MLLSSKFVIIAKVKLEEAFEFMLSISYCATELASSALSDLLCEKCRSKGITCSDSDSGFRLGLYIVLVLWLTLINYQLLHRVGLIMITGFPMVLLSKSIFAEITSVLSQARGMCGFIDIEPESEPEG